MFQRTFVTEDWNRVPLQLRYHLGSPVSEYDGGAARARASVRNLPETVTKSANRLEQVLAAVGFQGGTQAPDVDVHRALPYPVATAPDLLEQVPPRQYPPRIRQEVGHQSKFHRRKFDFPHADSDPVPQLVQTDGTYFKNIFAGRRRGPAQRGVDPGHQFFLANWLGKVVIDATVERLGHSARLVASCKHDDPGHASVRVPAHKVGKLETRHIPVHPLSDHQVKAAMLNPLYRRRRVVGGGYVVASALQATLQPLSVFGIVID